MSNNNFEIVYSSDCCGTSVHSDADLCPTCYEHCEVVEDRIDFDTDGSVVAFDSSLDQHGVG